LPPAMQHAFWPPVPAQHACVVSAQHTQVLRRRGKTARLACRVCCSSFLRLHRRRRRLPRLELPPCLLHVAGVRMSKRSHGPHTLL
jgi:hypothetical protein